MSSLVEQFDPAHQKINTSSVCCIEVLAEPVHSNTISEITIDIRKNLKFSSAKGIEITGSKNIKRGKD